MSLTEDIAQLVARTNALLNTFEAKEAAISAAVQVAVNTAASTRRDVWVDPVKGNDANTGLTPATAFLTLDRAIEATAHASAVFINLLGDVTMRKRITTYSTVLSIQGMDGVNELNRPLRKISFAPLASNSPNAYSNTFSAGIEMASRLGMRTEAIQFVIPDMPSTTTTRNIFGIHFGMTLTMRTGGIYCDNAATVAVLFSPWFMGPIDLWLSDVTIGTNARGHILDSVAANADPNATKFYRSNVTAL